MFERWKEKREHKRARNIAIRESMYWREHALLHNCMEQMRGCCTVAPMELHEAAVAVVNIAMEEGGLDAASREKRNSAGFHAGACLFSLG